MLSVLQLFFRQRFLLITALLLAVLQLQSCNKPTEPAKESISVTVEDVSCTEAWLKISDTNANPNIMVIVKRDDIDILILNLNKADTVIVDENRLPNKTYTYRAVKQQGSNLIEASKPVTATTLDTTSHNFTWQTFEFGEYSSSTFYDVAIIDENNIWAVGEIYMKDSLGNYDPIFYNAAHWNGTNWQLKKIFYKGGIWSIRTVYAFNKNDIWFSGYMRYYNGQFLELPIPSILMGWQINKLWGSSSNDLYAVGNGGNIAHWNGSSWKKIESGTNVDLIDIWGISDGSIIWIAGKNLNKTVLIKIENNTPHTVFEEDYPWQIQKGKLSAGLSSIWAHNKKFLYVTTPITVYRCLSTTKGEGEEIYPYNDYLKGGTIRIRGTGYNNILTAGNNSSIYHYNGHNWSPYESIYDERIYLRGLDVKPNLVVVAGEKFENMFYYKGIIRVGKK